MITAHQDARSGERLATPDVLQMSRPLVLRSILCDAPRKVVFIDRPRPREIVRAHGRCPIILNLVI